MLHAIVRVDRRLRRLWLFGQRIHHGPVGVALVAFGTALCVHDRRDYSQWFHRGA